MSVYEQLKRWQRMPRAREEWSGYRTKLAAFITAHTQPGTVAAILGAGPCDDMDLPVLSGHFRRLVLVDQEPSPIRESERIQVLQSDFLGITPAQYEEFCDCLQQGIRLRGKNTDIAQLAGLAREKAQTIYDAAFARPLSLAVEKCDYIIAAGVHSQLNNMLAMIWNAYEQALGQREPAMYPYFAAQNDRAVCRFDEAIVNLAAKGLVCALERQRLGVPGSVQGAAQALEDFERYVQRGQLRRTAACRLVWNFDLGQAIAYDMQLQILDK